MTSLRTRWLPWTRISLMTLGVSWAIAQTERAIRNTVLQILLLKSPPCLPRERAVFKTALYPSALHLSPGQDQFPYPKYETALRYRQCWGRGRFRHDQRGLEGRNDVRSRRTEREQLHDGRFSGNRRARSGPYSDGGVPLRRRRLQ